MEKVHDDFITKFQVFLEFLPLCLSKRICTRPFKTFVNRAKGYVFFTSYEHEIGLQINYQNKKLPKKVVRLKSFRDRNNFMLVIRWSSKTT